MQHAAGHWRIGEAEVTGPFLHPGGPSGIQADREKREDEKKEKGTGRVELGIGNWELGNGQPRIPPSSGLTHFSEEGPRSRSLPAWVLCYDGRWAEVTSTTTGLACSDKEGQVR